MPSISKLTRQQIRGYLEGFIEGMIQEYRLWRQERRLSPRRYLKLRSEEATLKPFHDAILPAQFRKASAFERSFSTRLGATFEECARLIASQHHALAQRGYRLRAELDMDALNEVEIQLQRLDKREEVTFAEMVRAVLQAKSGITTMPVRIIADLHVRKHDGTELYFEIKSPVPNKGQCFEVMQRLLRIHLARSGQVPDVQTYFAMPYNPYGGGRETYRWDYAKRYLPFDDAVLIGAEFWDMLGGEGTYLSLLEIYYEVGEARAEDLMELLHGDE
ncbi:MAG: TdeIII family type II restriction endonuclease [Fimbriimonadales bacterium]|nr:TdeIII family type II restriction endonuclease [Fimbriimonadales bacterium]